MSDLTPRGSAAFLATTQTHAHTHAQSSYHSTPRSRSGIPSLWVVAPSRKHGKKRRQEDPLFTWGLQNVRLQEVAPACLHAPRLPAPSNAQPPCLRRESSSSPDRRPCHGRHTRRFFGLPPRRKGAAVLARAPRSLLAAALGGAPARRLRAAAPGAAGPLLRRRHLRHALEERAPAPNTPHARPHTSPSPSCLPRAHAPPQPHPPRPQRHRAPAHRTGQAAAQRRFSGVRWGRQRARQQCSGGAECAHLSASAPSLSPALALASTAIMYHDSRYGCTCAAPAPACARKSVAPRCRRRERSKARSPSATTSVRCPLALLFFPSPPSFQPAVQSLQSRLTRLPTTRAHTPPSPPPARAAQAAGGAPRRTLTPSSCCMDSRQAVA